MTNKRPIDIKRENAKQSRLFDFESTSDYLGSGIRVRPAELARLFGVTKQAVSCWVKEGKIELGLDGRVDPRKAIYRMLTKGDPARLRAAFLKPIVAEIDAARQQIIDLETRLEESIEEARFNEESSLAFLGIVQAMENQLPGAWLDIVGASDGAGVYAILHWLEVAQRQGIEAAGDILGHIHFDDDGSL